MFDEPVLVEADQVHIISANITTMGLNSHSGKLLLAKQGSLLRKPCSFSGNGGTPSVTVEDVTFTFSGANGMNNGTSVFGGQIPQVFFRVRTPRVERESWFLISLFFSFTQFPGSGKEEDQKEEAVVDSGANKARALQFTEELLQASAATLDEIRKAQKELQHTLPPSMKGPEQLHPALKQVLIKDPVMTDLLPILLSHLE